MKYQQYHTEGSSSLTPGAGGSGAKRLADLATLIASILVSEGTELEIKKATLLLHIHRSTSADGTNNTGWSNTVEFMVADAAIADATPAAATRNLAALLDQMTGGNFEFDVIGGPKHSRCIAHGGAAAAAGHLHQYVDYTIDFTSQMRQACKRLIRSPVLATNPEIALVVEHQSDAGSTIYFRFSLIIQYVEVPRPSRMLR